MTIRLEEILQNMLQSNATDPLADYLDQEGHPDASLVRALADPMLAIQKVGRDIVDVSMILRLDIEPVMKRSIALQHCGLTNDILFDLGCDFADHALPVFENWNAHDLRPRESILAMRQWIQKAITDDQLRESRLDIRKFQRVPKPQYYVVQAARQACSPWSWAEHCVGSRNSLRIAELAEKAVGPDELLWQLQRISQRVVDLPS